MKFLSLRKALVPFGILTCVALAPTSASAKGSVHINVPGISIGFYDGHHRHYKKKYRHRHRYRHHHNNYYYYDYRPSYGYGYRLYDRGYRYYRPSYRRPYCPIRGY